MRSVLFAILMIAGMAYAICATQTPAGPMEGPGPGGIRV
jgi:hypothetical protein